MFKQAYRIVVTGGNGFIGKYFVKRLLELGQEVINVDKLTYAADKKIQPWFYEQPNYSFIHGDIAHLETLPECDFIVNFAAESHVDNSIRKSTHFLSANAIGVQNLLEIVRGYEPSLRPVFVQISTDEVYGDNLEGFHTEEAPLKPSNPYSASKAAGENILLAFARTYDIKFQTVRMANNYGIRQYPEKLIPRSILRLLGGLKAQLHGDGSYRRCWLNVEDAVEAILTVMVRGDINGVYNVGSPIELSNRDLVYRIVALMGLDFGKAIEYVKNRPGQDIRYGIDDTKLRNLGWGPKIDMDQALKIIIEDGRTNPHW
jgi:dTDP-glucose 4,6-dehydratase